MSLPADCGAMNILRPIESPKKQERRHSAQIAACFGRCRCAAIGAESQVFDSFWMKTKSWISDTITFLQRQKSDCSGMTSLVTKLRSGKQNFLEIYIYHPNAGVVGCGRVWRHWG
jgi:hypothetical protein